MTTTSNSISNNNLIMFSFLLSLLVRVWLLQINTANRGRNEWKRKEQKGKRVEPKIERGRSKHKKVREAKKKKEESVKGV